ncbi:Uncharacterised protein [uncultured archaeon]|nr:Uncharacterised protein [uncultured archaeon]
MHDSAPAMRPLQSQVKALQIHVKLHAPGNKLPNPFRPLLNKRLHRRKTAQPGPSLQSVAIMQPGIIIIPQSRGNAALSLGSICAVLLGWEKTLGHNRNIQTRLTNLNSSPKTGSARPHHYNVTLVDDGVFTRKILKTPQRNRNLAQRNRTKNQPIKTTT